MDKKENFKIFVKKNPILIKYVKNNEMSWQKFYEIYDMYGEDDNAWNDYIKQEEKTEVIDNTSSMAGLLSWLKNINLDSVQEGVESLQRVVGVIGDLSVKDTKTASINKPRPLYKHFDD